MFVEPRGFCCCSSSWPAHRIAPPWPSEHATWRSTMASRASGAPPPSTLSDMLSEASFAVTRIRSPRGTSAPESIDGVATWTPAPASSGDSAFPSAVSVPSARRRMATSAVTVDGFHSRCTWLNAIESSSGEAGDGGAEMYRARTSASDDADGATCPSASSESRRISPAGAESSRRNGADPAGCVRSSISSAPSLKPRSRAGPWLRVSRQMSSARTIARSSSLSSTSMIITC